MTTPPSWIKADDLENLLNWLDAMRNSGDINMMQSGPALQHQFNLSGQRARDVVVYWMLTYSDRHPATPKETS